MSSRPIDMADPFSSTSAAEVEGGAAVGETLIELANERDDIVLLAPDVGRGPATTSFIDAFPERYVEAGIAETNSVSMAAGLAAAGMRPFVLGIGAFLAPKCLEQIRTDIAINRLPVTMIAAWGGLDMGFFGASHHGLEDFSILRGTPHLVVASAADANAMRALMRFAIAEAKPIYLRNPTDAARDVYETPPTFTLGEAKVLAEGKDVLLVGTGFGTHLCKEAAAILAQEGIRASVVDAVFLKPFDGATIARLAAETGAVVTVEEHNILSGLNAMVAESLGRAGVRAELDAIGLPDGDIDVAAPPILYERYDLTPEAVARRAKALWKRKG